MAYQKISKLLKESLPKERDRILSPKQIEKLQTASHIALAVLAAVGITTISVVAPNLLFLLKPLLKKRNNRGSAEKKDYQKVAQTFYYLKKHGYIKFKPTPTDVEIQLTPAGKSRLKQMEFESLRVEKKTLWDGKWWQIAADIPTQTHRNGADSFRTKLKNMGFFALQKSLWFYPFDPREEIEFICRYYGLENFVTAMEINRMDIEDEEKLKEHFQKANILKK